MGKAHLLSALLRYHMALKKAIFVNISEILTFS